MTSMLRALRSILVYPGVYSHYGKLLCLIGALCMLQVFAPLLTNAGPAPAIGGLADLAGCHQMTCQRDGAAGANAPRISQADVRAADIEKSPDSRHAAKPRADLPLEGEIDADSDPVGLPGRGGEIDLPRAQFLLVRGVPALPIVVLSKFIPPSWRAS